MENKNHSVVPRAELLIGLRHSLGWTQEIAALRSGYSERLIRKLEQGSPVRSSTLVDVLTSYHEGLQVNDWNLVDFLVDNVERLRIGGSAKRNRAAEEVVTEYFDVVFNQRQIHRIPEFIAEDIKFTGEGRIETGIQVIEQRAKTLLTAFAPIVHQMLEISSVGCKVFCRWSVRMKHVGEFLGIPPSSTWVDAKGQSIVRVIESVAVETHDQWDVDHVIRQLRGDEPIVI
jgi:predicted ester cyclase